MTYDELKTKIRDYTEVDSNVFTDTIINGFIEDAEFRLLREVDSDNNRFYATATLTVDQRYVKTPDDLLIVRSAQIVDSSGVGAGTERDFLDYRDTNFMAEYNKSDATGVPKYYSYWDESHLVFAPVPNATYSIQLNYILKPQGLSSTNATTYLSQKFPNGLLYACLVEAYGFLKVHLTCSNIMIKNMLKQLKDSQLSKWEDEDEMNIKVVFLELENNKEFLWQ